jgi:hypothetical protein
VKRTTLGFLIAPLWAPLAVEINALRMGVQDISAPIIAGLGVSVIAYGLAFAIGFPLLRRLGKRAKLWMLALAGVVGGLFVCLVLLILFWAPTFFRYGLGPSTVTQSLPLWAAPAVFLAVIGALIGGTYWLIIRPELQSEDKAQYF